MFASCEEQSDEDFGEELHEPTEEEIEQMMLENAEVLEEKGKTVIGWDIESNALEFPPLKKIFSSSRLLFRVNFNRFIPKCDFIKDSAVFQVN